MTTDIVLIKLDNARNALVEAKTIQDTKNVYDAATATLVFAKRQKVGKEIELQVTEFMMDALKQLGEMLKETPRNKGARLIGGSEVRSGGSKIEPPDDIPTLSELGIDKKTSKMAQDIANLPIEMFSKLKRGEMTANQASKEIKRIEKYNQVAPVLPSDKYRVFYADPPWKYSSGEQHTREEQETTLISHYPSMSIQELCDLPVDEMAEDNAVLFMWTTSPLLEECFEVINAWGFKYKTSIVWNKEAHNVGHYVSVRHEFLLICTRGSCKPDIANLLPSVVSEKRTEHSVKPETFRMMIDTMYPNGKRIELFARRPAEGWEVWGNEPRIQ